MKKRKLKYSILTIVIFLFCYNVTVFGQDTYNSHVFYYKSVLKTNSSKQVALTFDDGPDNNYTLQILDILKKYKIKATFFLIGARAKAHPDVVKKIINEGHVIGNHTWNHPDLLRLSKNDVLTEVSMADEELFKIAGYHSTLFRPPYGNTNSHLNKILISKGYNIILWSVDTRDWAGTSVYGIMKDVRNEIRPGGIILQHCNGNLSNTVKALPQIITYLKDKGYSFVTIPELLNIPATKESAASASSINSVVLNADKAQKLYSMGLYESNLDLDAELNRETCIALLVKSLGKGSEALAISNKDVATYLMNFKDADKIAPWARNFIAYSLKNGLLKYMIADKFEPLKAVDAAMLCTIILRDMGYNVTDTDTAISLLKEKGGLSEVQAASLKRKSQLINDDFVGIVYSALNTVDPFGNKLIDNLITKKLVTRDQAIAAGIIPTFPTIEPLDIASASLLNSKMIEVTLNKKVSLADLIIDNVIIKDSTGETVPIASVFPAPYNSDNMKVLIELETETTADSIYTLSSGTKSVQFSGVATDTSAPTVCGVNYLDHNKVEITFSEPIDIRTGVVIITEDNDAKNIVPVNNISYNGSNKIIISTADQKAGVLYTLDIKDFKDFAGDLMKEDNSKSFGW